MKIINVSALFLALLCSSVGAQDRSPKTSTEKSSAKPVSRGQIDPEMAQRRTVARSLLTSLAIEARSYRDETLRARIQARIAYVLWQEDKVEARNLFRRAWEVAEAVDTRDPENNRGSPGRLTKDSSNRRRTNIRSEILKLIARRDPALGEELLTKLSAPSSDNSVRHPESSSESEISERLRLANGLLEAGELGQALQFAGPALLQATPGVVQFLIALRDKNATVADQRFMVLLSNAAFNPQADANTV